MNEGARRGLRWLAVAAAVVAVAAVSLGAPGRAPAAGSGFQEFPIAEPSYTPSQIVAGHDGRLWYTTQQAEIEAMTTAGVATAYTPTANGAGSAGIAASPNGTVAYLQGTSGNAPTGSISAASTTGALAYGPTASPAPGVSLTAGPDGNLWYVTPGDVCRIDPSLNSATRTCLALPGASSQGTGITRGPDGNIWLTETGLDSIVKVNPALPQTGAFTSYSVSASSHPFDIVAGPDGALWFTEVLGNRIGRITTSGQVTEYNLPNANSDPEGITTGPDGALWFAEAAGDRIGRIDTAGHITEFPIPTAGGHPTGITTGPDGALWFTEAGIPAGATTAKIGRYLPASTPTTTTTPPPPPVPSLGLVGGVPAVGHVLVLDPGGSRPGTGSITGYAYDFDGSGSFAATCPVSTPVAYKVFDTPGSHVIGLRVTDSSGLTSTTHLTVRVAASGPGTAHARRRDLSATLAGVSRFWCGTAAAKAGANLGYLSSLFTSEVHAVGIDVTQGVVPDPPRPSGLVYVNHPALGHLATTANSGGVFALNNDQQDPNAHKASWLQQFGTTVARVYASALLAPNGTDVPNVQMKLYGFRDGHELPGSPLLSQTGPLDVKLGPPFTTHAMRIGYSPVDGAIPAFTFTLPANWVDQPANYSLLAVPVLVGSRLDRQCSTLFCRLAEQTGTTFQLNSTGLFIVRSVAMESTAQINGTAGAPSFPSPWTAFDAAANLSPVAVLPSPYQGTINIDSITTCKPGDASTPCANPNGYATTLIGNWLTNNQPVIPDTVKVATIGVHSGYSQINGYSGWPGACSDNANGGALCESSANSPVSQVDANRPLTSVAHEMFHDLGRPHADATTGGCGGNGEGVPDAKGHMQAIGLDRHPGSGGSLTNPYKIISQDLPTQPTDEYDLMSYCTDNYPETNSWLSAHTWDSVASDWIFFLKRAAAAVLSRLLATQAAGPQVQITGVSEGATTAITQIEPATATDTGPSSSPYRALIRNASGAVVGNVPLTVTYGHLDGRGHSTPVAMFHGTVPAAGAELAQVTLNGSVIASAPRSPHVPSVRLIAPRRGRIGTRRTVLVRWAAHDADGGALIASVDYSTNGGRSWRTVYTGANSGRISLPSTYFTGAANARIRVRVNDGFNETRVASGRLRAVGSPPAVTILSLRRGEQVTADATTLLRGGAFDDAFNRLTGRSLTWFAGARKIGTGEMASVSDLTPGRVTIRLLARDHHGRTGAAAVTLRVTAVRPFFTALKTPTGISRKARSVRLRIATNVSATLQIGRHRFFVSPRGRTLTVAIKPGKGPLRLALTLSEHRRRAVAAVVVARP
ncbi:MAG: hypothetical protein WBQ18_06360 [Solirubrobacteraceae bacterium]